MILKAVSPSWPSRKDLVDPKTKKVYHQIRRKGGAYFKVDDEYGEILLQTGSFVEVNEIPRAMKTEKEEKPIDPIEAKMQELAKLKYHEIFQMYEKKFGKQPVAVKKEKLIEELARAEVEANDVS